MQVAELKGYGLPVWGPTQQTKTLLVTGTWSHAQEQTSGGESVLRISDLKNQVPVLLAHTLSPTRFSSLDWIDQVDENGVIAGGMEDGAITLWSASKILEPDQGQQKLGRGCISAAQIHNGVPVRTLEFNPHKKNLLASGGSEVLIQDISQLKKPTKFKPGEPNFHEGHRITSISWNRVVSHILASASENGKIVVWDLKQSKSIFQFTEPKSVVNSNEYDYFNEPSQSPAVEVKETQIIWNPLVPTQFVVANDDDQNPSFNIWDLRNPQYPVATFQNLHQAGILSVNWCLKDPNLVASTGKDGLAIVTNFKTGKVVLEFPTEQVFSSIKWSQNLPGKLAATSSEGDTSILSYSRSQPGDQTRPSATYAPKWLFPKCGARFGFGGKLITFKGKCLTQTTQIVDPAESNLCKLVENFDKELQQALQMSDLETLLEKKARSMANANERLEMLAIRAVAMGDTTELMKEFGIDNKKINFDAERFLGKQVQKPDSTQKKAVQPVVTENPFAQNLGAMSAESAADFFATLGSKPEQPTPQPQQQKQQPIQIEEVSRENVQAETVTRNSNWNAGVESMIKKNLMVGNLQYAAECALKCGRTAEAFLIAQMGGPQMQSDIQSRFFESQQDPFLATILKPLLNKQLKDIVQPELSHLVSWQEKIAYIYAYVHNNEEQEDMIYELAKQLMQRKEVGPAIICFILAHEVLDVLELWRMRTSYQLKQQLSPQQKQQIQMAQFERFVLYKLSVTQAGHDDSGFDGTQFQTAVSEVAANLASNAATAAIAMKFSALCQGNSKTPLAFIRDRIYKAHQQEFIQSRIKVDVPQTPYDIERVTVIKQQQQRNVQQQQKVQPVQPVAQAGQQQWQEPDIVYQVQPKQPKGPALVANFGYNESTKQQLEQQREPVQQRERPVRQAPPTNPGQPKAPRPAMPVPPPVQTQQNNFAIYEQSPTVTNQGPPPIKSYDRQPQMTSGGQQEQIHQDNGIMKPQASGPPRHLVQPKVTPTPRPMIRPQLPKVVQPQQQMQYEQPQQQQQMPPPRMTQPPPMNAPPPMTAPPPGGSGLRPMQRR